MLLESYTKEIQSSLAEYCRTGDDREIDGTRQDRLPHYRRLIYNVIEDTLSQAFPITYELLDNETWNGLVNDFFANHNSRSPQIWKMPHEFYLYAKEKKWAERLNMPYLIDLLYFEWIEIEVHTMPDEKADANKSGDLMKDILVVNPEHRLILLNYPIHKGLSSDWEHHAGNYYILIYREAESGLVRFMELSTLLAVVFEQLKEEDLTAEEILIEAANVFGIDDRDMLMKNGIGFLEDLRKREVIIGFKK